MNFKKYFLFALYLVSFISCQDNEKIALDNLAKEVIKIHDEVMPKTLNQIPDAKKSLVPKLVDIDSTVIFDAIKKLDDADEAMKVWMNEYNGMNDTLPIEKIKVYLDSEMKRIRKVAQLINESLKEAKDLIEKQK
jgi:hypothetical protein